MDFYKNKRNHQIAYLIASYAVWGIFWGGWGILLPSIKTLTGATEAMLGKALIGTALGAVPTMLFTGILVKKFSKWSLFWGLILFSASITAICFVKTVQMLAVVLFFVGASSGALDVIMNAGVAAMEAASNKKYFNQAHAAFPIAVIAASPIVGLARQLRVNINIVLLCMSGVIAVVALTSLKLDVKQEQKSIKNENTEKTKSKRILLSNTIILLGILGLMIHIMENSVEQWAAIYLEEKLFSAPAIASLGLTGYMAMLFLGRLIAQKASQKLSENKILMFSCAIAVFGFIIVNISLSPFVSILGFSIAGLGIAPIVPLIFSITGRSTTADMRIKAISSVTIIAYTGYLLSPPLVGYIAAKFDLKAAWILMCGIGVASIIVAFFLKKTAYTHAQKQNNSM